MVADNFQGFEIGGTRIDLDNLHSSLDGGTINAGTITKLLGGTVDVLKAGTINIGTVTVNNSDLVIIDYEHEKIHDSEMWGFSHYAGTIAAAGSIQVTFIAGTVTPHVILDVAAGAACQINFIHNPELTGGTLLPVHNRTIAAAGSSLMSAKHSGTITGGTALLNTYLPGGDGKSPTGGSNRGASEWILPASGTVTVQLIGIGDSNGASINCEFYEENE